MTPLSRDALARMVALHLPEEGFVNLGIGTPTHVADYLPAGSGVILHSENGILNVGQSQRRARRTGISSMQGRCPSRSEPAVPTSSPASRSR